jgi:uroporphyrinogen-III synthase
VAVSGSPAATAAGKLAGYTVGVTAAHRRDELAGQLERHGARVVLAPDLRIVPLTDPAPLRRLVDLVAGRLVDAVAFTSAPAIAALLRAAGPDRDAVLEALRGDVLAACVDPATSAPLRRYGIPVVEPARASLGALVKTLVEELPPRARTLTVAGHELTLRGHAAVVDGDLRTLAPTQMAVLKALAAAPGRVLSRASLLRALPRGADGHAVEMAVARLRAALGDSRLVQTVVKRGYRLPVE